MTDDPAQFNGLVLIVVGADLRAEMSDRPLAYRLREAVLRWRDGVEDDAAAIIQPVVCTDLWYVNNAALMQRPTLSVGDPSMNAATAYLATKIPVAFVIQETLKVHLDPEWIDLRACLWGVNVSATAAAVDLFAERYLDAFLEEVLRACEAGEGGG